MKSIWQACTVSLECFAIFKNRYSEIHNKCKEDFLFVLLTDGSLLQSVPLFPTAVTLEGSASGYKLSLLTLLKVHHKQ